MTPFVDPYETIGSTANLSMDGMYRYRLVRRWAPGRGVIAFVMLNPSTADAVADDPTIRRCMGFARGFDCGGVDVVNLYAYRATQPVDLRRAMEQGVDVVGPWNTEFLDDAADRADALIVAWGAVPAFAESRAAEVAARLAAKRELFCLGRTGSGQPRHPLFVVAEQRPVKWKPR